jgi:fluoride exporter
MGPGEWLAVAALGGCGAVLRFLLDGAVSARVRSGLPYGTLAVNLSGAFTLGVLVGSGIDRDALHVLAVGLLGSYTTFSTWMLEAERLAEERRHLAALANCLFSLGLGLAVAWSGIELGGLL